MTKRKAARRAREEEKHIQMPHGSQPGWAPTVRGRHTLHTPDTQILMGKGTLATVQDPFLSLPGELPICLAAC